MAFANKTDYIGLASAGNLTAYLELRSNSDGATNQNLEIPKSDGSIIGNEKFGSIKAPTCEYAIKGTGSGVLSVGHVYGTNPYALQSITYTTGAGQEPTLEAASVQIESAGTKTYCVYVTDALSVSPARHASTFGAVTLTAESSSLALQSGTLTIEADISPATINGQPIASDATAGKQTVVLTVWTNSDTTAPQLSPNLPWVQTADWACTGADSQMFTWTATFTKYLTAVHA